MTEPLVSIVVPSFNSYKYAEEFFKTLEKTAYKNFEMIVIDDNSTDGTKELLIKKAEKDDRIELVFPNKHLGIPKSRNLGLSKAKGKYTAFAELDMKFDTGWLSKQVLELEKDPTLGGTMGVVLDAENPGRIQAVGLKLIPQTSWVVNIGFGEDIKTFDFSQVQYVAVGAVGSLFRTDVLNLIKGNDEELVRNIEDIDMGWRVWIAGYKIKFVKESIIYHVTSKDWEERKNSTPFKHDVGLTQITRVILKNYELKNIIKYFPQTVLILILRVIVNLFKGNTTPLKALIYTFFWTVKTLPSTLRERKYIQSNRGLSDKEISKHIMVETNLVSLFKEYHSKINQKLSAITYVDFEFCPICEEKHYFKKLYSVNNPRKEIKVEKFIYKQCSNCSFIMLFPVLSISEMQKIYQDEDYYVKLNQPLKNPLINAIMKVRFYKTYSNFVTENIESKKNILDIGCGNGDFLFEMKQKGYNTYGLDPYDGAIKKTGEKIGHENVFHGNIKDIAQIPIKPDAVTMWHVLEHLESPVNELRLIAAKLNSSSFLFLEVPGGDSFMMKFFKENYNHNMIPEHTLYFTIKSLRKLLEKSGFSIKVICNPPKALLNFSLSLNELMKSKKFPPQLRKSIFLLSIPVSIVLILIENIFHKGELIRVAAIKNDF